MGIQIITLQALCDSIGESKTEEILKTFKSIPHYETGKVNDVEYFLHNKAIAFEKMTLSTTHLIFSNYRGKNILVGYFSLANKPLTMSKKNYVKLTSRQKRELCQNGNKTESGGYRVNSYLIGQLGKNFSDEAVKSKAINGKELLTLAYETVMSAKLIINARFVWLECENQAELIKFYSDFGFTVVENYTSDNGLIIMVMKLV